MGALRDLYASAYVTAVQNPRRAVRWGVLLLGLLSLLLTAVFGRSTRVWIDNGSDREVTVDSDDGARVQVRPHAIAQLDVGGGAHRLRARIGADVLDVAQLDPPFFGRGAWVFNVEGRNSYTVWREGQYPRSLPTQAHVFAIPDGVSEAFLTARGGLRLVHLPGHPEQPCCHADE
jgi:hypothetical protein